MSATNITSKCRMASIELDDAMILPHAANLDGSNFRKGQVVSQFEFHLLGLVAIRGIFSTIFLIVSRAFRET